MILHEAITYLQEDFTTQHPYTPARSSEAKQLGIEALKRLNKMRHGIAEPIYYLLPSETEG